MPDEQSPESLSPHDHSVMQALARGRTGTADDSAEVNEMRLNRRVAQQRTASSLNQGMGSASLATARPRDPMWYWRDNNLPFDVDRPEELRRARDYCRLLYLTHPVIASAIDIYSQFPLTEIEVESKDPAIKRFYDTLFFDNLEYEDFLVDVLREYWTVGEALPFGSFSETLGVWEEDELINPDDVRVRRSPFQKDPVYEMRLPDYIREIIRSQEPKHEYDALIKAYPHFRDMGGSSGIEDDTVERDQDFFWVSPILLKHLKFKAHTFHPRGIPILLRGFRATVQEEMMNAAQDSIADRLYTPLILTKLGASANDLGTSQPWIPTEDDLREFEASLDIALAGDFRMLTHHFAVDMRPVFGRETMPRMDNDFERLTERQLQVFGLSKTMISGGERGQTYAADAMNRDLVTQLLKSAQKRVRRFFRHRAAVVAEAQEHWDYEIKGGRRVPIMEEVLVVDPETGQERIEEQPKLLIPDLKIKGMNMKDEDQERQFVEALRNAGVPVSMDTRLHNIPVDLEDEMTKVRQENVDQAIEAQRVRRDTYLQLKAEGLPIPDDLRRDFEATAVDQSDASPVNGQEPPSLGNTFPGDTSALVPGATLPGSSGEQGSGEGEQGESGEPTTVSLPRNQMMQRQRPPESDEQRGGMPKSSSGPERIGRLSLLPPRHVGMRRNAEVEEVPASDEEDDADEE